VNGKNGQVPTVGVADSAGIYYWTAAYNGGTASWILDSEGNKVKASGQNGTSFFTGVDVSSGMYALFTMPDGTTVKIPLYAAYERIIKLIDTVNTNIATTKALVEAIQSRTYIKSVQLLLSNADTVGYSVTLSTGKTLYLYNGYDGVAPLMSVAKDTDGIYYWTVKYGLSVAKWVLDSEGNKVKAVAVDGKDGSTPLISVRKDADDIYYWIVIVGTDTSYVKDSEGNKIAASAKDGADGTAYFKSVTTDSDFMTLVLADGTTTFKVPIYKQFALSTWNYGTTSMGTDYTISTTSDTKSYVLSFVVSCSYITLPDIQYYASSGISSVTMGSITSNTALSTFTGTVTVTFIGTPIASEQKLILFFGDGQGKVLMRTVKFN
jgi:uncharacterized protein YegP (UPF0339 family)